MPDPPPAPGGAVGPGGLDACTVLHVDMDAFFASVEVLDDPSLAGKPLVVGGTGARGVVASCTYEARAYGIRSAMSAYEARRRCPHAVFLPGRYERYSQTSDRLHSVFERFTPLVEPISLDEAFLDVAGARRSVGSPPAIAQLVRSAVRAELGLECSVGVARTKLLAKLASRAAKPVPSLSGTMPGAGVVVVPPDGELSFLHPLPIRALWGVGPATARRLSSIGVETVGDLAAVPGSVLRRLLGSANGGHLAALSRGEDARPVVPAREAKSVGHEETFATDLLERQVLHRHVVRMSDAVADRLRESSLRGRTVTLKVRYPDRTTISRSQTLASGTCSARAIAAMAQALLDAVDVGPGLRLLGVSVSGLVRVGEQGRQLSFDSAQDLGEGDGADRSSLETSRASSDPLGPARTPPDAAWEEVEAALAQIRGRYGRTAVASAALAGPEGISVKRRGEAQWGPSDRRGGRSPSAR
ncbi:MAG TPA: DNA polymerase IV [Acidimicrobiales bacterium]|nr:DNA polymerase IV [Acidimicrobiales bacterium]